MYNNGDYVTWKSGANGGYMRKKGQIVKVLSAYENPVAVKKELAERYGATICFDGAVRAHTSYIVLVKNGTRKPKLYHPKVANLHPYYPAETEVK